MTEHLAVEETMEVRERTSWNETSGRGVRGFLHRHPRVKRVVSRFVRPALEFIQYVRGWPVTSRWFLLYYVQWGIARLFWRPSPLGGLATYVDHYRKHKFCQLQHRTPDATIAQLFKCIKGRLDAFYSDKLHGYIPVHGSCLLRGFNVSSDPPQPNQLHFDAWDDEFLSLVLELLQATGVIRICESISRSRVTIFNIRVWRFLPEQPAGDGHATDFGEAAMDIGWHTDHFPPKTFKFMVYPREVDASRGCLHIKDASNHIAPFAGYDQILVFDNSALLHCAPAPKEGYRDTIELSVMPRIVGPLKIHRAGYATGYPLMPFSNWSRPVRYLKSV